MTLPTPDPIRPQPILDALKTTSWRTLVGSLVSLAAGIGILTTAQADSVNAFVETLLVAVTFAAPVIGAVGHMIAAWRKAEPQVTPVSDPMIINSVTGKLVELVPAAPAAPTDVPPPANPT